MKDHSEKSIPKKAHSDFVKYCIQNLDFEEPDQFEDYFSCVPLCAINAVYSINTKYVAVENAVQRFCNYFDIEKGHTRRGQIPPKRNQKTVSEIYKLIKDIKPQTLASKIFENRQRTSPTNGILKSDASVRFIKTLKDFDVETFQDIRKVYNNAAFHNKIKEIPGQKSGISLRYFFMTTGTKNQIKPDRWIIRCIENATGLIVSTDEAFLIVENAVKILRQKGYPNLSERHLDNLMWNHMAG